jgi:hypothetical protein
MSIQPNYETYRYTGEIARLQSQSIVECRLPASEIGSILAVQAKAIPVECTCHDGEVRYNGRLLLCLVYEDADRKICRMERGAEFYHKAENACVTPACFAKAALEVENVSHRREGSGLYISVVVGADIHAYGSKQAEYLIGGESVCVQTQEIALKKSVCISGETEAEDEFETDEVGDILLHSERAIATSVSAQGGEIFIDGELALNVCVLAQESVRSYERFVPFKMQIPCEEAFDVLACGARVTVKNAQLSAVVDEEKNRSKIVFSYCVAADCFLTGKQTLAVATDAFSPCADLHLKRVNDGGRYLTNQIKCTERVSGTAVLSPVLDGEYALQAAVKPVAQISYKRTENGVDAEGVLSADILLKSADGGHRTCNMQLPFAFPLAGVRGGVETEIDALVCGLNVRRKKDGVTEAEATVKLCVRVYENAAWEYIGECGVGEEWQETDAAVSIFVPRAGEDLWQVAKRLKREPEELLKSNPTLEFPVKDGERIFVYRQIK